MREWAQEAGWVAVEVVVEVEAVEEDRAAKTGDTR